MLHEDISLINGKIRNHNISTLIIKILNKGDFYSALYSPVIISVKPRNTN